VNLKRLAIGLLSVGILPWPAEACLWISGTSHDGQRIRLAGSSPVKRLKLSLETSAAAYADARKLASLGSTAEDKRNNMAVDLIFRGEPRKAIKDLEELEAERPGNYITAANLGTAYELAGDNQQALRWITEAIRRNADSHDGTEWLHVCILETKIKLATDPQYFQTHSVLDLDHSEMTSADAEVQAGGARRSVREIMKALDYQLTERLRFVKTNDPPVASLLYDYAMIEARTHTLESAVQLLKMAARLGYPATRIEPLIREYERTILMATIARWLGVGAGVFGLIALVRYARHQRRMGSSRDDLAVTG
jgi:tetratricopeptide (TPR) repeat protein